MATPQTKGTTAPRNIDIYALLKQDHEKVRRMFRDFRKLHDQDAGGKALAAVARRICGELSVHTQVEEEIFYPAVRDVLKKEGLVDEAHVEHDSARALIALIEDGDPADPLYAARVGVLGEYVEHHIREEHDEIFPQAREAGLDAVALGEAAAARKQDLMEDLMAGLGVGTAGAAQPTEGGNDDEDDEEDDEEEDEDDEEEDDEEEDEDDEDEEEDAEDDAERGETRPGDTRRRAALGTRQRVGVMGRNPPRD